MTEEFDIIETLFAPLAAGAPGAYALKDDAALLDPAAYVVTADTLIEGVHFRKADAPDLVARKLLRVNLSDLAAKGAKPLGYFLTCAWAKSAKREKIETFARGLGVDQEAFRISLYGGDTTRHSAAQAPQVFTVTMFGAPARQGVIRREGARSGDDLYVSGAIGDAHLGLLALEKAETFPGPDKKMLAARYQLPEPRLTLGGALSGVATAAIDVSDGLLADAGHLAAVNGSCAEIHAGLIPFSDEAARWRESVGDDAETIVRLATGGDDYEILFTAPQRARRAVEMAAQLSKTPVTRIGAMVRGQGVRLMDEDGEDMTPEMHGYDHFAPAEDRPRKARKRA